MPESMSAVTLWSAAAILVALGYFIRFQGRVRLIAGADPDAARRETALANLVGGLTLLVGALTAILGVAVVLEQTTETIWGVYTALVLVSTAGVALRARRY